MFLWRGLVLPTDWTKLYCVFLGLRGILGSFDNRIFDVSGMAYGDDVKKKIIGAAPEQGFSDLSVRQNPLVGLVRPRSLGLFPSDCNGLGWGLGISQGI